MIDLVQGCMDDIGHLPKTNEEITGPVFCPILPCITYLTHAHRGQANPTPASKPIQQCKYNHDCLSATDIILRNRARW